MSEKVENNFEILQLSQESKPEMENEKCAQIFRPRYPSIANFSSLRNRVKSILVRLLFLSVSSFQMYFFSCIWSEKTLYMIYSYFMVVIMDGVWVVWKRAGCDYYWFSISFATYTSIMTLMLFLEIDFKFKIDDPECVTNRTILKNIPGCINTNNEFTMCSTIEHMVISFLASLVVGRWIMPTSKRMQDEAIFYQVACFTTLSADLVEIAQFMQSVQVVKSNRLLKAFQVTFAVSIFQFSFSLGAFKQRDASLKGLKRLLNIFLGTEAWSLTLSLLAQELPCFVLRLLLIFQHTSKREYALYFFALKNGLMVLLLIYRIILLCWRSLRYDFKPRLVF